MLVRGSLCVWEVSSESVCAPIGCHMYLSANHPNMYSKLPGTELWGEKDVGTKT